jgi:hypothetical protein
VALRPQVPHPCLKIKYKAKLGSLLKKYEYEEEADFK